MSVSRNTPAAVTYHEKTFFGDPEKKAQKVYVGDGVTGVSANANSVCGGVHPRRPVIKLLLETGGKNHSAKPAFLRAVFCFTPLDIMRILIFGGVFDPPHQGHINAAEAACEQIKPDIFYIIPAFKAPLKDNASTDSVHRINMCRLAFSHLPNAQISETEIKRGGESYTYLTLQELRQKHPADDIFLLIGTDQLNQFDKWVKHEYILENCTLCVAGRGEQNTDTTGKNIIFLNNVPVDVSSTGIRGGKRENIPEKVKEYIKEKGLYRGSHVQGVIKYAEMLRSDIFPGIDKDDVYTAASMHDSTKGQEQLPLFSGHGVVPDADTLASPAVMHAFTAALELEKRGEKENIVNAVRYHTTGRPGMTDIEKIVFIADYIEENRQYPDCVRLRNEYLRSRENTNTDDMIKQILQNTVTHLREKGGYIHPLTLDALEYYKNKENK